MPEKVDGPVNDCRGSANVWTQFLKLFANGLYPPPLSLNAATMIFATAWLLPAAQFNLPPRPCRVRPQDALNRKRIRT